MGGAYINQEVLGNAHPILVKKCEGKRPFQNVYWRNILV
jgi:hypothetical protein